MGDGFSRTGDCITRCGTVGARGSIGGGAASREATDGGAGGAATGFGMTWATLAGLATGPGLTDIYTIPDATTAPATNADTIFPSILEPPKSLNVTRVIFVS